MLLSLEPSAASRKDGTPITSKIAPMRTAIIISISVKPRLPVCRGLTPLTRPSLEIVTGQCSFVGIPIGHGLRLRTDGGARRQVALQWRIGISTDQEGHSRAIVERDHARNR